MIVTFYSFKGGVGRSMALINVAELLADRGYRVTICDWDLEAPGLERYVAAVRNTGSVKYHEGSEADELVNLYKSKRGLIDLLRDYKQTMSQPAPSDEPPGDDPRYELRGGLQLERPSTCAQAIAAPEGKQRTRGWVKILTAGKRDGEAFDDYAYFLQSFSWTDFYDRWAGASYLEFFREDLERDADIVLIDSRTGVTEHGGVCTHHLADVVVLLTAPNHLNLEGSQWMAEKLSRVQRRRPLYVLPVASRVDITGEFNLLGDFRTRFASTFRPFVAETISNPDQYLTDAQIIYKTVFSFVERVVVSEPSPDTELARGYGAIVAAIEELRKKSGLPDVPGGAAAATQRTSLTAYAGDPSNYMFRYAAGDEIVARNLVSGLATVGLPVWCDVRPGVVRSEETWSKQFRAALQLSRVYVLLRTPSTPATWLGAELDFAQALRARNERLRVVLVDIDASEGTQAPAGVEHHRITGEEASDPKQLRSLADDFASLKTVPSAGPPASPGLSPFGPTDAACFFERDDEIFELLELLERQSGRSWLHIEGVEGVGKSSLLRAGLLPAIRRGWLRRIDAQPLVADVTLGLLPMLELRGALLGAFSTITDVSPGQFVESMLHERDVALLAALILRALPPDRKLIVQVDALDRAFELEAAERESFNELLAHLLEDPRVLLISAAKEHRSQELERLPALAQRLNTNAIRYVLRPFGAPALRRLIELWMRRTGVATDGLALDELAAKMTNMDWGGCVGLALRAIAGPQSRIAAVRESATGSALLRLLLDEKLGVLPKGVGDSARAMLARLADSGNGILPQRVLTERIFNAGAAFESLLDPSRSVASDPLPALVKLDAGEGSVSLVGTAATMRAALAPGRAGTALPAAPVDAASSRERRKPHGPAASVAPRAARVGVSVSALFGGLMLLGSQTQARRLEFNSAEDHARLGAARSNLRHALSANATLRDENARLHLRPRSDNSPLPPLPVVNPDTLHSELEKKLQLILNQTYSWLVEERDRSQRLDAALSQAQDIVESQQAQMASQAAQLETQTKQHQALLAAQSTQIEGQRAQLAAQASQSKVLNDQLSSKDAQLAALQRQDKAQSDQLKDCLSRANSSDVELKAAHAALERYGSFKAPIQQAPPQAPPTSSNKK